MDYSELEQGSAQFCGLNVGLETKYVLAAIHKVLERIDELEAKVDLMTQPVKLGPFTPAERDEIRRGWARGEGKK